MGFPVDARGVYCFPGPGLALVDGVERVAEFFSLVSVAAFDLKYIHAFNYFLHRSDVKLVFLFEDAR